jgi:hypothetical protein
MPVIRFGHTQEGRQEQAPAVRRSSHLMGSKRSAFSVRNMVHARSRCAVTAPLIAGNSSLIVRR